MSKFKGPIRSNASSGVSVRAHVVDEAIPHAHRTALMPDVPGTKIAEDESPAWPWPAAAETGPEPNCASITGEKTMKRAELTEKILSVKRMKELTWEEIANKIGGASKILITAACMGQMKMTREQATKAGKLFGLGKEEVLLLQEVPYRGSLPQVPPTDPLIYRFYELVQVYGTTWKELIQEEFGDGIMSAIDFDMTIERQPDQKGDRVKIGMSGKFLGYKTY